MDYEAALISKILLEGCMDQVVDMSVKPELFMAYPVIWKEILATYSKHGEVPPVELIEERFPDLEIKSNDTSSSILVEELRKRRAHYLITEGIRRQADLLKKKDPFAAMADMRTVLLDADTDTRPSRDVNIVDTTEERLKAYNDVILKGGMLGIGTPWSILDEATQGFQNEDLIMLAGRGGTGKTWAEVILSRYNWHNGYKPLLITREMGVWQIIRRFDAVHAQLPYGRFRGGHLTTDELERWKSELSKMKGGLEFWVSGDDEGSVGVSGIRAKIRRYRPQIVYIDGGYLIEDERGGKAEWSRFANVCWDLKRLARSEGLPIVMTHQFSKEGLGKDGTADTLKFGDVKMWFDLMIGLYRTEELQLNKEMLFRIIKGRESEEISWVTNWDLEAMEFDTKDAGIDDVGEDSIDPEEGVSY